MRAIIGGLMLAAWAAGGCASDHETKPGATSGPQAQKNPQVCTMQSGGRDVLRLRVPADAKCAPTDGYLHVKSVDRDAVHVWLVSGAGTVDEALARVGQQVEQEFKDLKVTDTTPLTIAGAPAKRLTGSGTEADDGDPGHADIVVFNAGGRVFIACAHGEYLSPAAHGWLLTVVQTAQAP